GYTVPNPVAQRELIRATLDKAGIHAQAVSYVEAHGTGTSLGDPIEVTGLTQAFRKDTQETGFCALGSVKSNIGHLEAAAGIAGVTKIVLQMKYQQLVPSLHAETLNTYINFAQTPFVVQQELTDWRPPQITLHGEIKAYPRIAAISSFGAGGANAHVVLQEYVPDMQQRSSMVIDADHPAIIVLSARNEEQLKKQAQQLLEEIVNQQYSAEHLANIAYTLQVGREVMEERLAIIAASIENLNEKLEQFLAGRDGITDLYRGQVKRHKEVLAVLAADEEIQKAIDTWVSKRQYGKLLDLWVNGLAFDWHKLYGAIKPYRISLPTYPFARQRYWLDATTTRATTYASGHPQGMPLQWYGSACEGCPYHCRGIPCGCPAGWGGLHPLVQHNTSTLWQPRFSSTFHGNEFFLADHVIKGQRTMPGVAYLEMARVAVREAIGAQASPQPHDLQLSQVVWVRPLVVGELPVTIHITLQLQDNTTLAFLISHKSEQESVGNGSRDNHKDRLGSFEVVPTQQETATQIYCQGRAVLRAQSPIPNVDLASVQIRCQRQLSAAECYRHYSELSINYGAALQAIEQLMVGEGEVLARLRLPEIPGLVSQAQTATQDGDNDEASKRTHPYMLHPSMLDAALQACIGLLVEQTPLQEPHLPFALEELSIVGIVPAQGWAWICQRRDSATGVIFDIDVCDDEGRVAARLHGLHTRPLPASFESPSTMLLTPYWKEVAGTSHRDHDAHLARPSDTSQASPLYIRQLVLLCDLPAISTSRIQAQLGENAYCCHLTSSQSHREERFQDAVIQLVQEIQRLLSKPTGYSQSIEPVLVQVVVAHKQEPTFLEALVSVLKTAQQEYTHLRGQLIEAERAPAEGELLDWLREHQLRRQHESHIRYQDGKCWVRAWQELGGGKLHSSTSASPIIPWKQGGCYLISGGAGGLARLFVQDIARHVETATAILVGRSVLSAEQRLQLEHIGKGRIHIDYQQVDVSDGPAVHALMQSILWRYGHLHGIIHAAGILRDSLLPNKTPEHMRDVLAPKIAGVEHLDKASADIPLDFFVLCSSLAAVVGNVGQADYAAANAYLDAFAHARRAQVIAGQRQGATVSINWPLWEEGGMQIETETIQMMRARLGIAVMPTETGIQTLYQALASGLAQVIVLHGQVARIKQRLLG
ncbi:MAG: SDR family NAD(P)-dependent oxidoreductase, partial [Chloroflexi bacterium]